VVPFIFQKPRNIFWATNGIQELQREEIALGEWLEAKIWSRGRTVLRLSEVEHPMITLAFSQGLSLQKSLRGEEFFSYSTLAFQHYPYM
jgi:hypothetical protein